MSDPKRGGSRDISELKQRLGLKKATTPTAGAAAGRPNGPAGGVVPPPGLAPPPPPQPVIPNAADDPFAAMNAMAAVGTVQRAPEIVIVNDGKPVENVGASSHSVPTAVLAALAVIMLIVGVVIGQIAKGANIYNAGLKDARSILGDDKTASTVKNVKKTLSELDGVLDEMKTKNNYRPDTAADKRLRELSGRLDIKEATVFRTAGAIEPELTSLIMSFYAGSAEVKGMLDSHVKAATSDDLALASGKNATAAATVRDGENATLAAAGAVRYGALMQAPTDTDRSDFGVKLVELGPPYCGGAQPVTTGKCENNEAPTAFAYRTEPSAPWTKGDLQLQGSDSVPAKKLLLLLADGTRDALIKGGEAGASEVFYVKRLRQLGERTKKLIEEANKLEQRLQAESSKSARFSFFL